jgi:N-acetyl-gamma-glutamyl-phosphate reductase
MAKPMDSESAIRLLRDFYTDSPFISVIDGFPHTKSVLGSNSAHLTARVDSRTGRLISMCAIDNLVKGASGQAIQCANISFGLMEDKGLPRAGIFP